MRKMVSVVLVLTMIMTLAVSNVAVASESEIIEGAIYGNELLSDISFENSRLGRIGNGWAEYYNLDTGFGEIVDKTNVEIIGEAAHTGNKAVRIINAGNGGGRGIYYKVSEKTFSDRVPGAEVGDVYEFSGWFNTDNTSGATVSLAMGGVTFENANNVTVTSGTWTKVTGRLKITQSILEAQFQPRINTNLKTAVKGSNYSNDWGRMQTAVLEEGAKFLYADDLSIRKVTEYYIDGQTIVDGPTKSDSVVFCDYDYHGIEAEGTSTIVWQSAETKKGTYADITGPIMVTASTCEEVGALMLSRSLEGKYIRAKLTPFGEGGDSGTSVYTDPFMVQTSYNIMVNPTFVRGIYGWSGAATFVDDSMSTDESGAVKITGEAVADVEFRSETATEFMFGFYAKSGSDGTELTVNAGNKNETFTLTETYSHYQIKYEVGANESADVTLNSTDAVIDGVSLVSIAPIVTGMTISGEVVVDNTIEIEYTYSKPYASAPGEGESTIEWYKADSLDGTKSKVADGKTLFLSESDYKNKYIFARIVPVDVDGTVGAAVWTEGKQCKKVSVKNLYITADVWKTNGNVIPTYVWDGQHTEGNSVLEWVQADSPNAPMEAMEVIKVMNSYATTGDETARRGIPKKTVNASNISTNGWLPLSQAQRGKYVAFRITPVDAEGNRGVPTVSEFSPFIEFDRNIVNNGSFAGDIFGFNGVNGKSYSTQNSCEDGTGSLAVNAETVDSSVDKDGTEDGSKGMLNGTTSICYYPSYDLRENVEYILSADMKLDYTAEDDWMWVNLLLNTNVDNVNGYGVYQSNLGKITTKGWTTVSGITKKTNTNFGDEWSQIEIRSIGRSSTSAVKKSGKYLMDNVSLVENIPWVTDVKISGAAKPGSTLKGNYTFHALNEKQVENNTIVGWQVADNAWGPWNTYSEKVIAAGEKPTLVLGSDHEGKYVRFYVVPKDLASLQGLKMWSEAKYISPEDVMSAEVGTPVANELLTASVHFENKQKNKRDITTVLKVYKTVAGKEELIDLAFDTREVYGFASADFDITLTPDESGEAVVYFYEGTRFNELRPMGSSYLSSAAGDYDKEELFMDNSSKSVRVYVKSDEPNMLYSVVAFRDGVDVNTITNENINNKIIYIGNGSTESEMSSVLGFSLRDFESSDEGTDCSVKILTEFGGEKSYDFTYYGNAAMTAVVNTLKTASADDVRGYLAGTLIGSKYDLKTIAGLDLTDYIQVSDKVAVESAIAGKDFTGRTDEIKTVFETKAKEQLAYEIWVSDVDESKTAITNAVLEQTAGVETELLEDALAKYNFLYEFDLKNSYGYNIELLPSDRKTLNSKLKDALVAAMKADQKQNIESLQAAFKKTVAICTVDLCDWENMGGVFAANNSELRLALDGDYSTKLNNTGRENVHKAMYPKSYTNILEIQNDFARFVAVEAAKSGSIVGENNGSRNENAGGGIGGRVGNGDYLNSWAANTIAGSPVVGTQPSAPGTTQVGGFSDIKTTHWASEAVEACVEKQIISGFPDGSFKPEQSITRAEFLKMLIKIFEFEGVETELPFDDVPKSEWYYDFVKVAYGLGLAQGVGDKSFAPDRTITREEMATFCARAMKVAGIKGETEKSVSFDDNSLISEFAAEGVELLANMGIINGVGDNKFAPKASATRAMGAKIAYELLKIL